LTTATCQNSVAGVASIQATGTATGPLNTEIHNPDFNDLSFLTPFGCASWTQGQCVRQAGDPPTTTFKANRVFLAPQGGVFNVRVAAEIAGPPFDPTTRVFATASVTCPRAP